MHKKIGVLIGFVVLSSSIGALSCRKCGPFPDKYKVVGMDALLNSIPF